MPDDVCRVLVSGAWKVRRDKDANDKESTM